jgi:hypothetical protein
MISDVTSSLICSNCKEQMSHNSLTYLLSPDIPWQLNRNSAHCLKCSFKFTTLKLPATGRHWVWNRTSGDLACPIAAALHNRKSNVHSETSRTRICLLHHLVSLFIHFTELRLTPKFVSIRPSKLFVLEKCSKNFDKTGYWKIFNRKYQVILILFHVWVIWMLQGGSNMTGTNCDLFKHNQSRSYLNHLVFSRRLTPWAISKPVQPTKKLTADTNTVKDSVFRKSTAQILQRQSKRKIIIMFTKFHN